MGSASEKWFTNIPLVLPISHILACSIFLFGYGVGFGGNIQVLFSVSDLFTVSFRDIAIIYLSALIAPSIAISARHLSGNAYADDRALSEPDPTKAAEIARSNKLSKRIVIIGITVFFTIVLIITVRASILDHQIRYYLLSVAAAMFLAIPWWSAMNKMKQGGITVEFYFLFITFAITAFGSGLDRGQIERRAGYNTFLNKNLFCQKSIILRSFSDVFVAISPTGQRIVIDKDCKIKQTFPDRPVFKPGL